ncbi:TPA: hypothetical protein DCQ22_00645 [Candidatus Nomurabacteria bacterium]|nr:hypothetical protein [Candidatus Nomurabacteria bacterium]
MLKNCSFCSADFNTDKKEKKFCSRICYENSRNHYLSIPCIVCGKMIKTNKRGKKYCSKKCNGIGTKSQRKLKLCIMCGKEFYNVKSRVKCCSNTCARKARQVHTESTCKVCGKSFEPRKKTQEYCSNNCKRVCRRSILPRICPICGIEFKPKANKMKYCSRECFYISHRTLPNMVCDVCGNTFRRKTRGPRFCSKECRKLFIDREHPRKFKPLICETCGKEFPYRKGQRHCSQSCFLAGTHSKGTRIEHELYACLDSFQKQYKKQFGLSFTIPDAFIPELNLCIYADGYYWHSEKMNKGKDEKQNKKLKELGYNVIRLKERKDGSLDLTPLKEYLGAQLQTIY